MYLPKIIRLKNCNTLIRLIPGSEKALPLFGFAYKLVNYSNICQDGRVGLPVWFY
uniref:Uncharacterized protein n=1 Tax=Rhizophagus irregularis (strain DAOM 181602 / DAOM 197198 / MUCL 43194) TaxID=747089 RepID=U9TQL7_RHIID